MPKSQTVSSKVQVQGVDSELTVGVLSNSSVFDDLSPLSGTQQRAQILLKRNVIDDVTLSNTNSVGLADVTSTKAGTLVTTQSMQNKSSTDLTWQTTDKLAFSIKNETDRIFEFQESAYTTNSAETHYKLFPDTTIGAGVNKETFYNGNDFSFERQTFTTQLQQKIGKLPLNWTLSPSTVQENDPLDFTQNRSASKIDQSLLWNVNTDTSVNFGAGYADWAYSSDSHQMTDRTLYTQWNRQLRKNVKLMLRTDFETTESAYVDSTVTREDKFRLTIGQQISLSDDFNASIDFQQEYQHDINSTWSPADHSATLSFQKKF